VTPTPANPIYPRGVPGAGRMPPQLLESEGDMADSPEEIAFWAPLPLAECAPINGLFVAVDREALEHQRWHRAFTLAATLCGGSAVLTGVWNVSFGSSFDGRHRWVAGVELALVGGLIVSIAIGLWQQRKNRWLLNRHKAELLRLLKFEFLTTPSVWGSREATGADWVGDKIRAVDAVRDRRGLRDAVSSARIAEELAFPPDIPSPTLLKLVEYYLGKRLNPQKEYLANRAQRNAFWDGALQRNVNTTLFFASVVAIGAQAGFIIWQAPESPSFIVLTTLGAASAPVIASMIRTLRSAFEFSRNRSRFLSAHDALSKLEQRLTHHLLWPRTNELSPEGKAVILRELEYCESQLRTEHSEWLRLMLEAEWFG
jgi:hypothetical protein